MLFSLVLARVSPPHILKTRETVLAVKPPQVRGAAAHADWFMRQRMLHLADLARAARGIPPIGKMRGDASGIVQADSRFEDTR